MSINKNNYEAFFLDYHEGNLSPQQVADLLLFLEQNPELKEEFESFENVTLEDFSNITFENKSRLKKEITIENKEEFFIKSVEGTLIPAEKTLLTDFIKQHPQYKTDLELFQKTILVADNSIIFENKESLKRTVVTTDDLLIASVEGLLSKGETVLLNQQLAVDSEMQHNLSLYKQTKLVADTSIVFEDKEKLKRKERKAIPLFYYVAVAASLLFIFGLYFMFNNNSSKQNFAETKNANSKNQELKEYQDASIKNQEKNLAQTNSTSSPIVKKSRTKKQEGVANKKDSQIVPTNNNQEPVTNIIENNTPPIANNEPLPSNNQQPITNNQQPTTNNTAIAKVEKKNENSSSTDYLTIKEIAVEKFKEKTLDENTLASQKKNGRLKRFSLWDVAQITTKGISKLTGRNVEVKPTYNDDGDVTAYALGNGIEMKRGR